jgi:cobalt transporter subunit CbtA
VAAWLRRLVFSAVCAGLLTGLLVTIAHQIGTVPVILKAEVYEQAADAAAHGPQGATHDHHEAHAWQPRDGVERISFTVLADVLTAIGYGLLLTAAFALLGRDVTWRAGLWWGLAGFATFTLAPGLGLPPEVPGTAAAPLLDRQLWWVATVLATGAGLALLAFGKRWVWPVLAIALIALPHLWGAPQPPEPESAAPAALGHQFVIAVTLVSFLSWAVLGTTTAYFYRRFSAA